MSEVTKGKIRITEHYYYTIDDLGNHIPYWVGEKEIMTLGKNGKGTGKLREVAEPLGFYHDLESMANACVRDAAYRKIKSNEITTIEQHLQELKSASREIKEAIGGY